MDRTLTELSADEFEELIERTIDKRMAVWLTQLLDALADFPEEEDAELQPDFAASLRRSIEQAQAGEEISLQEFRSQLNQ